MADLLWFEQDGLAGPETGFARAGQILFVVFAGQSGHLGPVPPGWYRIAGLEEAAKPSHQCFLS